MLPGEGAAPRVLWSEALSPAERRALLAMSPSRAWLSIGINWGLVAGAFALVAWAPNPLSVVFALFVIGGAPPGFSLPIPQAAPPPLFPDPPPDRAVPHQTFSYPGCGDPYHTPPS